MPNNDCKICLICSNFPQKVVLQYNPYNILEHKETIQILNVTIHPEFNSSYFYNDIALIHLNESVAMSSNGIYPACIPEFDIEELGKSHRQTGLKEDNCQIYYTNPKCNTEVSDPDKQQGNMIYYLMKVYHDFNT